MQATTPSELQRMDATYLAFGIVVAAAASLTIRANRPPWIDLDAGLRLIARWLCFKCDPPSVPLFETAWADAAHERVRLKKYALFGAILVALLPLHTLFGSDLLIDGFWRFVSGFRALLSDHFPDIFHAHGHDWRENPFELWEVCVLLWTITVLANVVVDDVVELKRNLGGTQNLEEMVAMGRRAVWVKQLLVVVGSSILIILDSALLRLAFEFLIVATLSAFDCRFFCSYSRTADHLRTRQFAKLILLVDFPVTLSFGLLLVFLASENLRHFESHWTTPFVAGAAALNLLLTSSIVLILKAIHGYEQQLAKARLGGSVVCEVGGGNGDR
jgi:hypothetical protein